MKKKSKVAVLLATFNGEKFIYKQLETILSQKNVDIHIFINDDVSNDETILQIKKFDFTNKIHYKVNKERLGPGKNFYNLISSNKLSKFDYVALSDQDDVWLDMKISDGIDAINSGDYDCYSSDFFIQYDSNNTALRYYKKSYKLKKYDYLFESPGPGCSFILTKNFVSFLSNFIKNNKVTFPYHDWFIYALARTNGYNWIIDSKSNLIYRQHDNNVVGANLGIKAYIKRFSRIISGTYYRDHNLLKSQLNNLDLHKKNNLFFLLNIYETRRKLNHVFIMFFILLISLFQNKNA